MPDGPEQFVVHSPAPLSPETRYALEVVFIDMLGVEISILPAPGSTDIEISLEGSPGSIFVKHYFLARFSSAADIPPEAPTIRRDLSYRGPQGETKDLVVLEFSHKPKFALANVGGSVSIGFDLFGAVFFLLSRIEEVSGPIDDHDRAGPESSLLAQHGLLQRPIVDDYVALIRHAMSIAWPRLSISAPAFCLWSTHDVDNLYLYHRAALNWVARRSLGQLRRGAVGGAFNVARDSIRTLRRGAGGDPGHQFERIMETLDREGIPGAFNFIADASPAARLPHGTYAVTDQEVIRLLRRIHERGFEVGLHPSYYAHLDFSKTSEELQALMSACALAGFSQERWGGRHHFLRWRMPESAVLWDTVGLDYDSSIAHAHQWGFRSGTCRPHRLFDLAGRRTLGIVERPLVLMDATLLSASYLNLRPESDEAFREVERARSITREAGGEFVILWHNDVLADPKAWKLFEFALTGR